jgi:hypothetical protein
VQGFAVPLGIPLRFVYDCAAKRLTLAPLRAKQLILLWD